MYWCWCFWSVVLEKTLGSPLDCKESKPVNSKGNQSWIFIGKTDVEAETPKLELTHLKRHWCWERLKVGREGDERGRDGWMAWQTQWTWVWVNSGSWWWTERRGVLQSMGSQTVRHNWATELNWLDITTFDDYLLPSLMGANEWFTLLFITNMAVNWLG